MAEFYPMIAQRTRGESEGYRGKFMDDTICDHALCSKIAQPALKKHHCFD